VRGGMEQGAPLIATPPFRPSTLTE
jgi:hypothetical protein